MIPSAWLALGEAFLRGKGIEVEDYQKPFRDRMRESIAWPYWIALVQHVEASQAVTLGKNEDVQQAIGKFLIVHRSNYNRWFKEESLPGADKYFATVVILLRKELREVTVPANREVIWKAVSRTLSLVREADCEDGRHTISREEFAAARHFVTQQHSDVFMGAVRPTPKLTLLQNTSSWVRGIFPTGTIRTTQDVLRAVTNWHLPYVLFRIGLPRAWEILDVEAVGDAPGGATELK